MARGASVADETVGQALGGHAGLLHRVLGDPRCRFGPDDDQPPSAPAPVAVLDAVRIPLAAGPSASAAGLAVRATAREHEITDTPAWVGVPDGRLDERAAIRRASGRTERLLPG